mgnify:CR=1 FL=1
MPFFLFLFNLLKIKPVLFLGKKSAIFFEKKERNYFAVPKKRHTFVNAFGIKREFYWERN